MKVGHLEYGGIHRPHIRGVGRVLLEIWQGLKGDLHRDETRI